MVGRPEAEKRVQAWPAAARESSLGVAARLFVAAKDTAHAIGLWTRIVESHADSPEAAESDLDWARVLRRRGDASGAVAGTPEELEAWIAAAPDVEAPLVADLPRNITLREAAGLPLTLNAVVHKAYDEARKTAGASLPDGPFRGVPFLIKDLHATLEGEPTSNGNKLWKDVPAKITTCGS